MPQTSPMSWISMSFLFPMSIFMINSIMTKNKTNFKQKMLLKLKFNKWKW